MSGAAGGSGSTEEMACQAVALAKAGRASGYRAPYSGLEGPSGRPPERISQHLCSKIKLESRARVALTGGRLPRLLQTAAWAARPTGHLIKVRAEARPPPACDYSFSSDSGEHGRRFSFRKRGRQEVVHVLVFHKPEVAQDADIDDAAGKFFNRQEFVDQLKHTRVIRILGIDA